MLPIESLRRMRKIDVLVVSTLAFLWAAIEAAAGGNFFTDIFITTAFLSFIILLMRRIGMAFVFSLLATVLAPFTNAFVELEMIFIPLIIITALVMEATTLFVKTEVKNVHIDVAAGSTIGAGSISSVLVLATQVNHLSALSFMTTTFLLGLAAGIAANSLWYLIKRHRLVIRYEYAV